MITEYVKKKGGPNKGTKYGAFAARLNEDGEIVIGHSKWHSSKDVYSPAFGMRVAVARAIKDSKAPLSLSLRKKVKPFVERAKRYYKTNKFSNNTEEMLLMYTDTVFPD